MAIGNYTYSQKVLFDALTSPLFIDEPLYMLSFGSYRHIDKVPAKKLISWIRVLGIKDSLSFNRKLKWLMYEGHRKEFAKLTHFLASARDEDRHKYICNLLDHDKNKQKFAVVNQFFTALPSAGIAAYDYALYLLLAKAGVQLNLTDESEVRSYCVGIPDIIQSKYSNWHEYHIACVAGVHFVTKPTDAISVNERTYRFFQRKTERYRKSVHFFWKN